MPRVTLIYGLPGSGKSQKLAEYRDKNVHIFDDFMANSVRDVPCFPFSRNFVETINLLRGNCYCVLSDIRLCTAEFRAEVRVVLAELVKDIEFNWQCFDCRSKDAVEKCRRNVKYRADKEQMDAEKYLKAIDEFQPRFTIEDDATLFEVVLASEK